MIVWWPAGCEQTWPRFGHVCSLPCLPHRGFVFRIPAYQNVIFLRAIKSTAPSPPPPCWDWFTTVCCMPQVQAQTLPPRDSSAFFPHSRSRSLHPTTDLPKTEILKRELSGHLLYGVTPICRFSKYTFLSTGFISESRVHTSSEMCIAIISTFQQYAKFSKRISWSKEIPPHWVFLFTIFPYLEPGGKGPPSKHIEGGPLSRLGNMVMRKPPQGWGGGGSFKVHFTDRMLRFIFEILTRFALT